MLLDLLTSTCACGQPLIDFFNFSIKWAFNLPIIVCVLHTLTAQWQMTSPKVKSHNSITINCWINNVCFCQTHHKIPQHAFHLPSKGVKHKLSAAFWIIPWSHHMVGSPQIRHVINPTIISRPHTKANAWQSALRICGRMHIHSPAGLLLNNTLCFKIWSTPPSKNK